MNNGLHIISRPRQDVLTKEQMIERINVDYDLNQMRLGKVSHTIDALHRLLMHPDIEGVPLAIITKAYRDHHEVAKSLGEQGDELLERLNRLNSAT